MSKFLNSLVCGIDVAADFSYAAILNPDGSLYRKPFRVDHDAESLKKFVREIQKVEKLWSIKCHLFMESTGIYHMPLSHFLHSMRFEVFIINPLITHSNRYSGIRKVKNDKKDAISIAKLAKYQDFNYTSYSDQTLHTLRSLCREYYSLRDSRSAYKIKLSSALRLYFPGYHKVFSDITGNTSLAVFERYPSPKDILNAPEQDLVSLIGSASRKGVKWAKDTYKKLIQTANNAMVMGLNHCCSITLIKCHLNIIREFDRNIEAVLAEMEAFTESENFSLKARKNLKLLSSISGMGFLSAVTILSEIGNFEQFPKPKHLVAFFGIDPAVNQSGKFNADKMKMSKRGTKFGRRALYAVVLACIRNNKNGLPNNSVLRKYYIQKCESKKKKVALGAIMHKLLKYFFAVLRDQKPYQERTPDQHSQIHFNTQLSVA